MARSLNRVTLIGNLGQDPEVRTIPSGASVCTLSIATTDRYKDRNGEWQESTEWHRVVLWERLAEIAGEYLRKGSQVYIEGKIVTRSYEDKDGVTKYITEIRGNNMIMMGGGGGSQGGTIREGGSEYTQKGPEDHLADDDVDDDVPF